jgi:hypothetical protein
LVAIERIRQDPDYGKTDAIEKGSSPELGQKYAELIVERLAQLAVTMVEWDETTRAAFVRSERALVDAQVRGWRTQHAWAAWDALGNKGLREYGAFLVAQDFASITAMAEQL